MVGEGSRCLQLRRESLLSTLAVAEDTKSHGKTSEYGRAFKKADSNGSPGKKKRLACSGRANVRTQWNRIRGGPSNSDFCGMGKRALSHLPPHIILFVGTH